MKRNLLNKNNRLIICCLILISHSAISQTIEKWYVNMPDILNPTLTKQNRLELVEYFKAKKGDSITNRFGHQAYLLSLDTLHQQIEVKNTPSSSFSMKIFNLKDSTSVIGIIRTVCAPVCQSTVEFYDTAWNVIPIKFDMPKAKEWIVEKNISAESIDSNWVYNLMKISFISLKFSSKDPFINAKNNTLEFLSDVDRKVVTPFISDKTIAFELKGRTWRRKL